MSMNPRRASAAEHTDNLLGKACGRRTASSLSAAVAGIERGREVTRLREAALAYARRGFAVLPLHGIVGGACTCARGAACTSPGKHPRLTGGVHGATCDPFVVERLWREHPMANIGIATGAVSGLIALDVDPRHGGRETLLKLREELGPTPRTALSLTGGGGHHYLFAYPEAGLATRRDRVALAGLDLQSDGAFIVAPPSRHVSGRCYRWREGQDLLSIRLATLPSAWLDRLQAAPRLVSTAPAETSAIAPGASVAEGGRNTHLASRAGVLVRAGLAPEALRAALLAENTVCCQPPLEEREVLRIADSVARYPAAGTGDDEAEAVVRAVLDGHYAGGAHLLRPDDGRFWAFDGTRWAPLGRTALSKVVLRAIQAIPARRGRSTAALLNEVLRLIEPSVAAVDDPLRFTAAPPRVINTRTTELWIGSDGQVTPRPHEPTSYLRHRFEVAFAPDATCPRYDRAVREIFSCAPDPAAMVDFWHELMGYAMQPDRRLPLVVLGWGRGSNGKTALLETFVRLVGAEQVLTLAIGDIEKSRFTAGGLLGKLAIIDDDVRTGTRLPDGDLKRYSEEKTITGETKYGPQFSFTARTAIFMLFNNPPSLADLSHGMQRRLQVVPFERQFGGDEADSGLFRAIWQEELSGVLNRYLAGLQRVIGRGWRLAPPAAVVQAKTSLLQAANPVPAFLDERCERTGEVLVGELYEAYGEWARRSGFTLTQQLQGFRRNLENLGLAVVHGNQGNKVVGLRLTSPAAPAWPRRA